MAQRFYLLPRVGTGTPKVDPFRPKYARDLGMVFRALPYGREPLFLAVLDLSPSDHATLVANADVAAFPADLDQFVRTATLASIQNTLESANLPGQWVAADIHKFSTVLKRVRRCFDFAQRFKKIGRARLFPAGITLGTEFRDLPQARRQALQDVAADFGTLDPGTLRPASTMRDILTEYSAQFSQVDPFPDFVL